MRKLIAWVQSASLGWPLIVILAVGFAAVNIFFKSINYQKVTGRENLINLLAGNTLRGDAFWFRYQSDGTVSGHVSRVNDKGVWYATENYYCEDWIIWGDGEERCWQLEQNEESIRRILVGDPSVINNLRLIQNK